MNPADVPVVGLIGGVGSGKSSLAKWLCDKLRVHVIHADAAGHRVLENPEIKETIRRRFGADVFDPTGGVRRDRLAQQVFGADARHQAARHQLEAIVHPAIAADLRGQLDEARRSTEVDVILLDAAVLLEAGWSEMCDAVVFVDAPEAQRAARVSKSRGWSLEELRKREASQLPLDRKQAVADCVVDNSETLETAGRQLLEFVRKRPNTTVPRQADPR